MACPEWEDADFEGNVADDFKPDWMAMRIKKFLRPTWFAQGPLNICHSYLIAKSTQNTTTANRVWAALNKTNGTKKATAFERLRRRIIERSGRLLRIVQLNDLPQLYSTLQSKFSSRLKSRSLVLLCASATLLLIKFLHAVLTLLRPVLPKHFLDSQLPPVDDKFLSDLQLQRANLINRFAAEFPDRADKLDDPDFYVFQESILRWTELFAAYDFIIGYSTDPFIPLLAGRPYFAFEHGTLRDIPYQADAQGRRTALSYRLAEHVFVTNFDCRPSAEFLSPGKYTSINHPYDEDHGLNIEGWKELQKELKQALDSEFLFFFPTRQDWVTGTGYADKANDIFLRAFCELRKQGYRVGLVCCEWGKNVAETRDLLKENDCEKYVRWVKPLGIVRFERMSRACDCVVDQFKLGAFGGVLFKAMAVGAPVLTYLNEQLLKDQYAQMPPVLNCATTEEIIQCVKLLISDPAQLAEKQNQSRQWIKNFHGKRETVNAQCDQFRKLMPA